MVARPVTLNPHHITEGFVSWNFRVVEEKLQNLELLETNAPFPHDFILQEPAPENFE
jgi:hypothetical protein